MARILAWTLSAVMAAGPLAGCGTTPPLSGPGPGASGACAPTDTDIDYARIRPDPNGLATAVAGARTGHVEVRRKAGLPNLGEPQGDFIRIFTWGSMLPGRHSLQAARGADGSWSIERVSEGRERGRLDPEPPSVLRASLTGEAARKLDALLADRCLYAEPTYYDRSLPAPKGDFLVCADGADSLIEIEAGGRSYTAFHACHAYGRAARVEAVLWEAMRPSD
jgi:hypothetical protein